MEAKVWPDLVNQLSPVMGIGSVVIGALITGWFQSRVSRKQALDAQNAQLSLLQESNRHDFATLALQHQHEHDQHARQFAESDRADRHVVVEYIDLLLPRLIEVASIQYLAHDNKDQDELKRYQAFQKYMKESVLDHAHPERNQGLRMAFLLYQLVAAMRIALNARWTRPLTDEQSAFLSHWESHIEPMLCSPRYPGKELLYREQVEIVTAEMLVVPGATKIIRPLNWKEFCEKCSATPALRELATLVADKLRFIFDEANSLPPRKAMQCRLAILALYLIHISKEVGGIRSWTWREEDLWKIVRAWFKWETERGQSPKWYVFKFGDAAATS